MANINYNATPVPNISNTAVQGIARDDDFFYLVDSTFGTSSEEIKKVSIQGITVATNSSLYTSIPAGNWKTNDCCIYEGLIYIALSDRDSSAVRLVSYNKSDLSFNTDISPLTGYEDFTAGVCIGAGNKLFGVAFFTTTNINAQRVAEFELDGTFVQYHNLSQEILEMQGITFDGTNYWISSSASNLVYELDGSFNVLNTYTNNAAMTEIEGVEFYEGKLYTHDIEQAPYIFHTQAYTPPADTFPTGWQRIVELSGTTPSGAIADNVMLITEANLPAEIFTRAQNGGEDLRACLSSDGTSQIPLRVLSFDAANSEAKLLVKVPSYASGSESVFIAYDVSSHVEQSPPNGTYGRNTVVSDRSLSMWDGTYDITNDGEDTSRQFVTAGANAAPTGLGSVNFRGGANDDYLEKTISNQQNYTITAWYRPDAIGTDGNDLVLLQNPTSNATSQSSLLDDASPSDIGMFNTPSSWIRSGVSRVLNNWQRIVVVGNNTAGTRKIWINGVLRATDTLGAEATDRTKLRIGARFPSITNWRMNGELAGVEVINKAVEDDYAATDFFNQNWQESFYVSGSATGLGGTSISSFDFTGTNGDPLPAGLTAQNGSFQIQSNRLATSGADPLGPKWVCTGESAADGDVRAIANCGGSNSGTHGVVARYSDNDNFWMLVVGGAGGGDLQLFKRVAGTFTNVQTYAIPSFGNTTDYSLMLRCRGNVIEGYLDGVLRVSTTDAHNSTANLAGVRMGSTAGQVDNLEFTAGAASNTISISTPQYRIWQRSGGNTSVTIEGSYSGTPTTIERQVDGGSWVTAIASPSGGTFSDTFSLATGQHTIAYRFSNDTGVTDSVSNIAVGDVFALAGQSNMSGRGTNNQTFANSAGGVTAYLFGNDDNYKQLSDPSDSDTNQVDSVSADSLAAGSWIVRFANEWLANSEVPVGFIPCALGGTPISDWSRSTLSSTLYGSMKRRIDSVGGVAAVLWEQGERDSRDIVNTPLATYKTALKQLATDVDNDFGCELFVIPLHTISASGYTNQATIRQAQTEAADEDANIRIGQSLTDIDLSAGDGLHFQTNAELQTVAERMYQSYVGIISGYLSNGSKTISVPYATWSVEAGV